MNDELSYAEMLEIPVETVTVKRKEKKKKSKEEPLSDKLVKEVNARMEQSDPAYAESTPIEREAAPKPKSGIARRVLVGELVAVVALCAAIFLTNLFVPNSAINTFVRGLFQGNASAASAKSYDEFTLSPVVNDYIDAEITVSETGVLSFTAQCSVYPPCNGTLESVAGDDETGYTALLRHSDSFTTIISGLTVVYPSEGSELKANLPFAYSDGESSVRVMFYDDNELLNCFTVGDNGIAWS